MLPENVQGFEDEDLVKINMERVRVAEQEVVHVPPILAAYFRISFRQLLKPLGLGGHSSTCSCCRHELFKSIE